jgi:hypothetical protein
MAAAYTQMVCITDTESCASWLCRAAKNLMLHEAFNAFHEHKLNLP